MGCCQLSASEGMSCLQNYFTIECMAKGSIIAAFIVLAVNGLSYYITTGENEIWNIKVKVWPPKPIQESVEVSTWMRNMTADISIREGTTSKEQRDNYMESHAVNKGHLSFKDTDAILYPSHAKSAAGKANRTWISLAVCWSGNTQLYGKSHFPYTQAAIYSSKLWHLKTKHEVVIQVVYEDKHKNNPKLLRYARELRKVGDYVVLLPAGSTQCAYKAQLARLLPHTLPFIAADDIAVTSDVDAFLIDDNIFENLRQPYKVWVYQYKHVIQTSDTIPACFVAMKKALWESLTRSSSSVEELLDNFEMLELSTKTGLALWPVDQLILSRFILESELCALPKTHSLYGVVKLKAPPTHDINDSKTCFHGQRYGNCFSGRPILPYGCPWWHFTPSTTTEYLQQKFEEIASGKLTTRSRV